MSDPVTDTAPDITDQFEDVDRPGQLAVADLEATASTETAAAPGLAPGDESAVPEPEPVSTPSLQAGIALAEARGYDTEVLGPQALRASGRFGEPTLGALELMLDSTGPFGVWADGVDGSRSAMCLWTGEELYAITLGEGGRWEHFKGRQGLGLIRDSWRGGGRGRYRIPHGPLMEPLQEAIDLAVAWGLPTPHTSRPAPTQPMATTPTRGHSATRTPRSSTGHSRSTTARGESAARAGAERAPRAARAATERAGRTAVVEEAPPRICPSCFMALPVTGRCDTCS